MMSIFKKNRKAFTIIELIVVIAILGILVLLAGPRLLGYAGKAELRRIQHDVKVMEQKIGTVFVSKDDDFNKWEDNSKDLNQLIEESRLFEKEKEGPVVAEDVEPTDEPYKVIPEKYKDKINTKLKGTFYANSGGKVYYEHTKPLVGIPSGPEKEPGDNDDDNKEGLMNPIEPRDPVVGEEIPIDSADELDNIGESGYPLDGEYILTSDIDLSGINWLPIGNNNSKFTGSFDGNGYKIINLTSNWPEQNDVGLFGYTDGAIIKNVALEDINVTGGNYVGGLVGETDNSTTTITNSYATGSVTGSGNYTGGLVGYAGTSTITNSYATGEVTGKTYTGGLVGGAGGSTIEKSYATGSVTGTGSSTGGLVGNAFRYTSITNSYAKGAVTGTSHSVGGLVGYAGDGTSITNSYATGLVKGTTKVGGLVGDVHTGTIENSYATGEVTGTGNNTGGLVGNSTYNSTISNSHATGSVSGGSSTGGLVGYAGANASINNSYATGSVEGTGNNVGGLVGMARALSGSSPEINNSYATGSVTGTSEVGGLVGYHYGIIRKSYATGLVSGGDNTGGFVGYAYPGAPPNVPSGRAFDSYWDKETTGQTKSSRGGLGKTTDEMKMKGTYKGWDFENTWQINEDISYPTLR